MVMKKLLTWAIVALAIWAAPCAQAQDTDTEDLPKHELSLGYGAISTTNVLDVFVDVFSAIFGAKYENTRFIGPASAEYFYHVSPLVGVGGIGVYNHHKEDVVQNEQVTGKRTSDYFTIMPAVKFNWLRKRHWGMYSKLAVGYTRANYTTTGKDAEGMPKKETTGDNFFNFQASLAGIEAGGDHVRGFAELGFGEQGVIQGGIRFRF